MSRSLVFRWCSGCHGLWCDQPDGREMANFQHGQQMMLRSATETTPLSNDPIHSSKSTHTIPDHYWSRTWRCARRSLLHGHTKKYDPYKETLQGTRFATYCARHHSQKAPSSTAMIITWLRHIRTQSASSGVSS